jgi:molybdate transport system substrate-binding protein
MRHVLGRCSALIITCLIVIALPAPGLTDEITVAAASDLAFAIRELVAEFERQTGHTVRVSLGSSGNFYAQIQNGAPFDLFFSADVDYPRRLEIAGSAEPDTLYVYATGRLVLWALKGSPMDVKQGWAVLLDARVKKIAIANPQHAPYGRAAVAALGKAGVYDRVAGRLVYGENIAQAGQFVDSGNAEIGVLALATTIAPTMQARGSSWIVPEADYPAIEQAAVILRSSRKKEIARSFLSLVRSSQGQAILRRYGFIPPASRGVAQP